MKLDYKANTVAKSGNISLSESGMKCIFNNKDKLEINEILVDKGLITDNNIERCDYIVYWESDNSFVYYVELKGSNVGKAFSQLLNTIKLTKVKFENFDDKNCVIVQSNYPQETTTIQTYKKKLKQQGFHLYTQTRQATIQVKKVK